MLGCVICVIRMGSRMVMFRIVKGPLGVREGSSSAASDVYKGKLFDFGCDNN